VQLEAAPLVWRVRFADGAAQVAAHTGEPARVSTAWVDEHGRLFLDTDLGFGIVHSQDMLDASSAIETGAWQPETLPFVQMPARFGYVLSPEPIPPQPH
jgi:DUF2946 family protein